MRTKRLGIVLLLLVPGCGRGLDVERTVVSGTVTYQNQPVADGRIRFVPTEGTKGPSAGALIQDGKYEVKASGGVTVGTNRVEIRGFRQTRFPANRPGGPQMDMKPERRMQFLPGKYNTDSTLRITIGEEDRVKNFDLK